MKNNCDYEKVIKELEIIVLKQEEEIKRLHQRNSSYLKLIETLLLDYRKEKEKNDNNV